MCGPAVAEFVLMFTVSVTVKSYLDEQYMLSHLRPCCSSRDMVPHVPYCC